MSLENHPDQFHALQSIIATTQFVPQFELTDDCPDVSRLNCTEEGVTKL